MKPFWLILLTFFSLSSLLNLAEEEPEWAIEIRKQDDLKWAHQGLELYEINTKKKPILKNILESLQSTGVEKRDEIASALGVFGWGFKVKAKDAQRLIDVLLTCYNNYKNDASVVDGVISTLTKFDEFKALSLAKEVFDAHHDTKGSSWEAHDWINAKIYIAWNLLRAKSLIAFPYLSEWILNEDTEYLLERTSGPSDFKELFREFLRFDGQPYNEAGDKVNIQTLMKALQENHLDPKYYDVLEKIRKEGPKPEEPQKPNSPWLEELYVPEVEQNDNIKLEKDPTEENLISVLENPNPNFRQISEVEQALGLINYRNISSDRILKRVEFFLDNPPNKWITLESIKYSLKHKDKETGINLLLKLLGETKDPLLMQPILSELLRNGDCRGYPKLETVITSKESYSYFYELIGDFIPFNGKPYNAQGDKIDLKQFVESLKDKVSEDIYKKMQKIVQEV